MSVVSSAQKYPIPIPFAPWPMCGMIVVVIVVVVVVVLVVAAVVVGGGGNWYIGSC